MTEERPELDPEVMAAVRETQRMHEMRKHKALAGSLIAEHLQRNIGAKLREEAAEQPAALLRRAHGDSSVVRSGASR